LFNEVFHIFRFKGYLFVAVPKFAIMFAGYSVPKVFIGVPPEHIWVKKD
jgi:hypothetical protein